jgi:hypothetical protein
LRYFALFLVRGFLDRKNVTACTYHVVYLLRCARNGTYPAFNLGVIFARTLSYVVYHNETKPIYAGAIATMVYEHIREERGFNNIGTEILESNLLDSTMLVRMDILVRVWNSDFWKYKYMVRQGYLPFTVLPCHEYFHRLSDRWIIK